MVVGVVGIIITIVLAIIFDKILDEDKKYVGYIILLIIVLLTTMIDYCVIKNGINEWKYINQEYSQEKIIETEEY